MIQVRRKPDGTCEVLTGHAQLKATIERQGSFTVQDADTRERLHLECVGDRILVVDAASKKTVERLATNVIAKAKRLSLE